MNIKRPVLRICIVTREKLNKKDLFRVAKVDGSIVYDKNQNLGGRGVYIKKDIDVINTARKKNVLSRGLKTKVNDDIYLSLINELKEKRD